MEARIMTHGLPESATQLRKLKAMGFSDARLGELSGTSESDVLEHRLTAGIAPVYKRIDTCAAEFSSPTAYMYSTYEAPLNGTSACEADPSAREKIIILGGGPNRIGQGIEFDYCCCHASFSSRLPATRPSWSTVIPKRSQPTTTPPTASISNPLRLKMSYRSSARRRKTEHLRASSSSSAVKHP